MRSLEFREIEVINGGRRVDPRNSSKPINTPKVTPTGVIAPETCIGKPWYLE